MLTVSVVHLLAVTATAALAAEEPDSAVRTVCGRDGSRILARPDPHSATVVVAPIGTTLLLRERVEAGGRSYLSVWSSAGSGYIDLAAHNLCYARSIERHLCAAGELRTAPGGAGQRIAALADGAAVRHFDLHLDEQTYVRYHDGAWREGWLPRAVLCGEAGIEDTELSLRRVCSPGGALMRASPRGDAAAVARLRHGTYVDFRERVAGQDGDYLRVVVQGQEGYLDGRERPLCYPVYQFRSVCQSRVPVRWQPSLSGDLALHLGGALRVRHYGHGDGIFEFIRYQRSGQWQSGWIERQYLCPDLGPQSPAQLLLRRHGEGLLGLHTTTAAGADGADPRSNIIDAAAGRPVLRSTHGTAPGGSVHLGERLLDSMLALLDEHGFTLHLTSIAGGSHTTGSYHYAGRAVDIGAVNGQTIYGPSQLATLLRQTCVAIGAVEAYGPDNDPAGHFDHVHCAW